MFANFELDHSMHDEYDTDITLEYDDEDMHRNFVEFYEDVLPEFKAIGRVVQFKVCCNYEPHLRGNVYVQFAHETDAQTAMMKFNARWYGGKQLSAEFVNIDKWKNAICGLYSRRRCPKGKLCNFLHVFHNPTNEFREADQDYMFDIRQQWQRNSDRRSSHRGQPRSERHRSRSPSRRRERHWKRRSSSSPESTSRRRRSTRQRSRSKGQSARNEDSSMRRSRSQSTGRSVSQSKNSTFGDTTNTEDRSPSMNSVKVRSHSRSHKKKQKHKTHKHCRSRRSRSASRDRSRTCTRTPSVQNGDEPVTSCPENINTAVLGQ